MHSNLLNFSLKKLTYIFKLSHGSFLSRATILYLCTVNDHDKGFFYFTNHKNHIAQRYGLAPPVMCIRSVGLALSVQVQLLFNQPARVVGSVHDLKSQFVEEPHLRVFIL
jgi:hypothetical protein